MSQIGERICGITHADIIGKKVGEAFPGARETGFLAALQDVFRTGDSATFTPAPHPEGCFLRISTARLYRLPSGEVVTLFEIPVTGS